MARRLEAPHLHCHAPAVAEHVAVSLLVPVAHDTVADEQQTALLRAEGAQGAQKRRRRWRCEVSGALGRLVGPADVPAIRRPVEACAS